MRKPRLFKSTLGILLAPILAACGGGNKPNPSASASETPGKARAVKVRRDNPCSVALPDEVEKIIGAPTNMREIVDEVTCRYHFEPPGKKTSTSAGNETFIEVKVHWTDGRAAITAARLAGRLLGSGTNAFEKVPGIGDEAWLAPMASYIAFSKGDVGVEIDMRMMPGEKDKAIALAKLIASRA